MGVIIGLYGCYCHPFKSWAECDNEHNKRLKIDDNVQNRHTCMNGIVCEILETKGFVIVKYGKRECDKHLEHVAELIKI